MFLEFTNTKISNTHKVYLIQESEHYLGKSKRAL